MPGMRRRNPATATLGRGVSGRWMARRNRSSKHAYETRKAINRMSKGEVVEALRRRPDQLKFELPILDGVDWGTRQAEYEFFYREDGRIAMTNSRYGSRVTIDTADGVAELIANYLLAIRILWQH